MAFDFAGTHPIEFQGHLHKARNKVNCKEVLFSGITGGKESWGLALGFLLKDAVSLTYCCTNVGMFDQPCGTGNQRCQV
jgi:hypothetical protein